MDEIGRLTIITICKEPLLNVLRFVAWHRHLGADRIVIHFDDPEDAAIPYVEPLDFVHVVRCTPEFWASIGRKPDERFVKRQNAAVTHAYRSAAPGWVGVLDGDELFYFEGAPLLARLAALGPEVRALRVLTAEVIAADAEVPGRPHFRRTMGKNAATAFYGEDAVMVRRNGGMVGHSEGKSLIRTGLKVRMVRQHFPISSEREVMIDLELGAAEGAYLLHFFAEGWATWRGKLDWRLSSWGFQPRVADHLRKIRECHAEPEKELRRIYDALHVFNAERLAALGEAGGHFRPSEDLLAPARTLFGAELIDSLVAAPAVGGWGQPPL